MNKNLINENLINENLINENLMNKNLKNGQSKADLKRQIKLKAGRLGLNKIGFANVERWQQQPMTKPEYWPQTIWPWCKTVISLGIQIFPSMIETTPSVVYAELYNTTNRFLDDTAYRLANYLNQLGYRAHFFPRDCYGDIAVLVKKPEAAFSQVLAGYYAGLGTIGLNHTLLTPEYGPRIRLAAVLTDAEIRPDKMLSKELCIKCQKCVRHCVQQVFMPIEGQICAKMDKHKCAAYHQQLKGEFRYPCGVCAAVCPVGADKKLYGQQSVSPQGIEHCQNFGSLNALENL